MASRSIATPARPLDERLAEVSDRFIRRPDHPGLTWDQARRVHTATENETLFVLLGALQYAVSADSGPLTKRRLFEIVERALTRAMAREADRAADLAAAGAIAGSTR